MSQPEERFPGRKNTIRPPGARLYVKLIHSRDGAPEIEIIGNRDGMRGLAAVCSGLAELSDEQLLTPANHYHLDDAFSGTEKGSVPLTVYCLEVDWPKPEK
jgi:hypothetical protein